MKKQFFAVVSDYPRRGRSVKDALAPTLGTDLKFFPGDCRGFPYRDWYIVVDKEARHEDYLFARGLYFYHFSNNFVERVMTRLVAETESEGPVRMERAQQVLVEHARRQDVPKTVVGLEERELFVFSQLFPAPLTQDEPMADAQ